ncbi:hypothetical protein HK100_000543 [Physocladia obscura]|uniref:Uncharacterized protein n=1 Tax=Physocladia obscura TaxID=109957 RepID=A0AAD5SZR7_9FUNG|nr:hypothetical protein HK100_000543 [Physocladia obscura]
MATTYVISPVYKSAWLPVSANVRPELFITVPCELSSFSMTAKNANLMYSGPNINTSVSVVFTNSGVIQFATPINAAQVVTLSTGGSKGSIYASDISATKIELKALKYGGGSGGTVEGIFSKYFQFSALNEIGPLRFALYPSVSRNLQPVRHDIESRNGQIDIICSKYKGHFTVSGTSDVFLSGVDWPIEKFEPTVGTVGGREAGDGVFDVVGSKGRKVVLDFR